MTEVINMKAWLKVNVKEIREGLFCVRNQWIQLKPTPIPPPSLLRSRGLSVGVSSIQESVQTNNSPSPMGQSVMEDQHQQYETEFKIKHQLFNLKVSFTKTNDKSTCLLKLFSRADGWDNQPLCAVWARFNKGESGLHNLKKVTPFGWKSEQFDIDFALPTSQQVKTNNSELLICSLWIEFEILSCSQKNVLQKLTDLFVQQIKCDVQFSFDGGEQIGGHVNILTASSSVFDAMFKHEMKETITGQVNIQDVQPETFKKLLYFIYSGQLDKTLTKATAQQLYVAADKYEILDLKKDCILFLSEEIRVNNVLDLMLWADFHSFDELKEATLVFIERHGQELSMLDVWENFMETQPKLFLVASRRMIQHLSSN